MLENLDKHVVIADVRFPNEAEFIQDLGGIVIQIVRPDRKAPKNALQHTSEAGIPAHLINLTVLNDCSLKKFKEKVSTTMGHHLL